MNSIKTIRVVVAVIEHAEHGILISRRQQGQHLAGLWEFPGGKIDAQESSEQALVRELQEELGITPNKYNYWFSIEHDYPEKSVCLEVYTVTDFAGQPQGREGQTIQWINPQQLNEYAFPEANKTIIEALFSKTR